LRIFSYRNKHIMKRVLLVLLAVLLAVILFVIGRFIYVQRFVVYEDGGAHLNYDQKLSPSGQSAPAANAEDYPFETVLEASAATEDGEIAIPAVSGWHITTSMLAKSVDDVRAALAAADDYSAVVLDVKSVYGNFYYSTAIGGASVATDGVDVSAIDELIAELTARQNLTVIARVPAFSDSNFALAHQPDGLPLSSGALWTDENGCYWLNPYSNDVQGYLSSIAIELSKRGFDEVLFDGFYVPDSERIVWSLQDVTKQAALADAAKNIVSDLTGYGIRVDFGTTDPAVAAYAGRIAVVTEDAATVDELVGTMADVLPDTATQIVFLTSSRDTRFSVCSVVRPLMDEE
jgi:hypothetical protein